jgi:hypothetical protein
MPKHGYRFELIVPFQSQQCGGSGSLMWDMKRATKAAKRAGSVGIEMERARRGIGAQSRSAPDAPLLLGCSPTTGTPWAAGRGVPHARGPQRGTLERIYARLMEALAEVQGPVVE